MTTFQPSLPNLRVAIRRPLIGMNGACALLGMASEEVDALVDSGFLVCFNIAVDTPQSAIRNPQFLRRELRFLVESVKYYQNARGTHSFEMEWPMVFTLIAPHDKPAIYGTEIDAALVCDPDHRLNLIRAGHLKTIAQWRPGRNGAPSVTRESFEQFLKARQL